MKQKFLHVLLLLPLFFSSEKIFAVECVADYSFVSDDPTIYFTDASSGLIAAYYWDFGDGSTASAANPEHTYAFSGSYMVCLTIYGFDGVDSCVAIACKIIEVDSGAGSSTDCEAAFYYGIFGSTAYFENISETGGAATFSYYWDFGDGGSSDATNPSHAYVDEGVYNVCLTITTDACSDTTCMLVYVIDSTAAGSCNAVFSAVLTDLSAAFTNSSFTDGAASSEYFWDFGDGSFAFTEDAVHVYDPGVYTVCLTIYTSDSCTDMQCSTLYVVDSIPPVDSSCEAAFNIDLVSGTDYAFTDMSEDDGTGIATYHWDFGDGSFSYDENPSHTYDTAGTYIVCLFIVTWDSCTSLKCDSVSITTGIKDIQNVHNLNIAPNPVQGSLLISFSADNSGDAQIFLSDLSGRRVADIFTGSIQTGKNSIQTDVSSVAEGVYFISVQMDNGDFAYQKIVIMK